MRRLPKVAVCLALGFVTTLAVAWGLAVRVVVTIQGPDAVAAEGAMLPWDPDQAWVWWCTVKRRPGLTVVVREPGREQLVLSRSPVWGDPPTVLPYRVPPRQSPGPGGVSYLRPEAVPGWASFDLIDTPPPQGRLHIDAFSSRGWPFRAVWYRVKVRNGARADLGGLPIPETLGWLGPGRVIPYRPLAAGLLADTALYAAAWYGGLLVPAILARRARERRGQCGRCGYDLRGGVHDRCPECGCHGPALLDRADER